MECQGTEEVLDCTTDADCTSGANGRCNSLVIEYYGYGKEISSDRYCGCTYSCQNDAECGDGSVCACVYGSTGQCIPSSCSDGSECGASNECEFASFDTFCDSDTRVACRTPDDECNTSEQCDNSESFNPAICHPNTDTWVCLEVEECSVGRPILEDEKAQVALSIESRGWIDSELKIHELTQELSMQLGAHWLKIAELEHSSVASFNRFSLQLMHLGAPAHLVLETQKAGYDEVLHAQKAYQIASRFLGKAMGPGPFTALNSTLDFDKQVIINQLIDEACFGETLGVAEVREAIQWTHDEEIRKHLIQVEEDESRHAQLAWSTLSWLVDQSAQTQNEAEHYVSLEKIRSRFEQRAKSFFAEEGSSSMTKDTNVQEQGNLLEYYGYLSRSKQRAIHLKAYQDVILPCVETLLGSSLLKKSA
jgi:hypothetical protein